jgi:hypothetical protein
MNWDALPWLGLLGIVVLTFAVIGGRIDSHYDKKDLKHMKDRRKNDVPSTR